MKKNIIFSGITRHTDDQISPDGECMELINARVKNGSITPIGKPIQVSTHAHKPVYIHKNSNYENIILLDDTIQGTKSFYYNTTLIYTESSDSYGITHVGNILIITTDKGIRYLKYESGYIDLGSKPPLPNVRFETTSLAQMSENDVNVTLSPSVSLGTLPAPLGVENEANVSNAVNGAFLKVYDKIKKNKNFTFPVLVRYAYKMYDGSYIYQSCPVYIESSHLPIRFNVDYSSVRLDTTTKLDGNAATSMKFNAYLGRYSLNMHITHPNQSTIDAWKDVVTGIDVFVSPQLEWVDFNKKYTHIVNDSIYVGLEHYAVELEEYSQEYINNRIETQTLFYKTQSIGLKSGTYEIPPVEDVAGKDTVTDDEFSHVDLIPNVSYNYNGRLHIASIKAKLFKGHDVRHFIFENNQLRNDLDKDKTYFPLGEGYIAVYVKTDSGITKVVNRFTSTGINIYGFSPYLSYPDTRAYKMVISFKSGTTIYKKEIDLKPSESLNLAYNLSDTIHRLDTFTTILELDNSSSDNDIEYSPSKIKVSEISNPFYFPAKNTYTAGNGDILALCSNTAAISQGQFGQYPLYAFTDEGVYAMQVGSGVVYSSVSPVSRDVCINKKVTPIDSAVVFATDSGLMAISGATTQKLSENIDGYLPSAVSDPVLQKILAIPKLTASTTEFKYYLENAEIGYNYQEKEIIISNSGYDYSYVYNLTSKQWSKLSLKINSFLNSYPQCLAVGNGNAIYDIHNGHRTVNDIALITRPIKFGSLTHKRIIQSALRGVVKPSLSDLYLRGEAVLLNGDPLTIFKDCGFYVLGSNDCEHYTFIAGTEKIADIRDLITKMNKTKAYKYFVFCLVGGVRTDVALNYVEAEVDEAYENRLR